MKRSMMMCLAILAAVPATAMAQQQTKATPQSANPEPKMICKVQAETGSHIATKRRCMTAEQWRQDAEAVRIDLQSNNDRMRTSR